MKDTYRRIFDRSFWISWFTNAIVNCIFMTGTILFVHKFGFRGTSVEFGLVIGTSAISISVANKLVKRARSYGSSIKGRSPLNAEFLFYLFLDTKTCDALVGDLEERYKLIRKKFGTGKADFWYWKEAIRSTGPIAWAWFKKLVMKPVLWVSSLFLTHGLLKDGSALEFVKGLLAELVKKVRG